MLYIWDQVDVQQALGYHAHNFRGIPYGFVFPELSAALHQPWSHTLSHEALELIADPHCNLLVEGPHPHPRHRKRRVFRWYEVCDPVQDELYEIDGVAVSNFVTPLYFTEDDERGGRNAFHHLNEAELVSFGTNPGGYVGFYDPKEGKHDTWAPRHDDRAQAILALKAPYQTATRTSRRRRD